MKYSPSASKGTNVDRKGKICAEIKKYINCDFGLGYSAWIYVIHNLVYIYF